MSYERSAPFYDVFGAKDDGAFLAALAARWRGPALTAESVHADYAGAPFQAGDAQAIFTFK